ncbi:unnamed protein product [Polarella glacialis]|uniref:Uncharacterized protein n=1 Tax=Polarella glacialis TaxID=89957 RepID=A0A813G6Y9_POLGL|nr:unnamed protein product [Polarella glacialis]
MSQSWVHDIFLPTAMVILVSHHAWTERHWLASAQIDFRKVLVDLWRSASFSSAGAMRVESDKEAIHRKMCEQVKFDYFKTIHFWSCTYACVCAIVIQVVRLYFAIGHDGSGPLASHNILGYFLCLMTKPADYRNIKVFQVDLFAHICSALLLWRICTAGTEMHVGIVVGSKLFRIWLGLVMSDHRLVMMWSVAYTLGADRSGAAYYLSLGKHAMSPDHPLAIFIRGQTFGYEVICSITIWALCYSIDKIVYERNWHILEARTSYDQKSALQRMLTVFCDSQVLLDANLKIVGPQTSFAPFMKVLDTPVEGVDFAAFVDQADVPRVNAFIEAGIPRGPDGQNLPPGSLHVRMHDANQRDFNAELFHLCLPGLDGDLGHLVGIRDENLQELSSIRFEEQVQERVEPEERFQELSECSSQPTAEGHFFPSPSFATLDQCKGKTRLGSQVHIVPSMASSASSCSETSESPEESPGMPELDNVLLVLDPFSVGYSILSCQLNYKTVEPTETDSSAKQPKMQDVISIADFPKFEGWIQDFVNANDFGTSSAQGLGSLEFRFPGSKSSRELLLHANDTDISVEWSRNRASACDPGLPVERKSVHKAVENDQYDQECEEGDVSEIQCETEGRNHLRGNTEFAETGTQQSDSGEEGSDVSSDVSDKAVVMVRLRGFAAREATGQARSQKSETQSQQISTKLRFGRSWTWSHLGKRILVSGAVVAVVVIVAVGGEPREAKQVPASVAGQR